MKKQKIQYLELWKKFQKEEVRIKKDKLRKELVELYYPLVQKISYKIAKKIQWRLTPEELTSYGVDGLYSAISRFSIDKGIDFPAYANRRISGSMIDEIRKQDIIPRSVRINNTLFEKTKQDLEIKKGRRVTEYEIIDELGIEQEEYLKNVKKYNPLNFISLEGTDIASNSKQDDFKQDSLTDLTDKKSISPDSNIVRKEFLNKLISKNFSLLEQKIVYYYYYENLTMEEIGEKIGSSESRISQIHRDILIRLKDKIKRNPDFFGDNIEEYIRNCNDESLLF